jgi:hypothetical protein
VSTRRTAAWLLLLPLVAPWVGAAAAGAEPDTVASPLRIVLMGDSYTAGNGAGGYDGPTDCYRSRGNWGELYRAWLEASGQPATLTNVACSGASTDMLTAPNPRDGDSCALPARSADEYFDPQCRAWLRPQVDAVDSGTDVVLLTMGGNDAGFSDVVLNCFVPGLRSAGGCRARVEHARAVVDDPGPGGVTAKLVGALNTIHAKAPRARVVLVGYPNLVGTGFAYTLAGQPGYDAGTAIRALGAAGVAAQRAAVDRVGSFARYVGVAEAFAGHEPEPRITHTNPARWLLEVGDSLSWKTWYHPNPAGHRAYRDVLAATLGVVNTNRAPTAVFAYARLTGPGNRVVVDGRASTDPDGAVAAWQWWLAGAPVASGAIAVIGLGPGSPRDLTLTVTDDRGGTATITRTLLVANRPPVISAAAPAAGAITTTTPGFAVSAVDPDGDPLRYSYRIVGPSVDLVSGWVAGAWRPAANRLLPGVSYRWAVTVADPSGATAGHSGGFVVAQPAAYR